MTSEVQNFDEIILVPLVSAYKSLKDGYTEAKTDLEKTGVVKRFEYCYELSWKTLKRVLNYKGIEALNPRDTFRESAAQGLIKDPKVWFGFIKTRNETSHRYDEELVELVYAILPTFIEHAGELLDKLTEIDHG